MLYGKEQKGPVSALTQVNGYLVSAIGQKVSLISHTTVHTPLNLFLPGICAYDGQQSTLQSRQIINKTFLIVHHL